MRPRVIELMEKKNIVPIFIIGVAHSGTTILYKMLGMHPDVCWFSQFSARKGSVPGRFKLPFPNKTKLILSAIFPKHGWRKEKKKIKKYIILQPSEADKVWGYIIPPNSSISEERSVSRMRKILKKECESWNKRFIISKLPRLLSHVSILNKAYPEAKFLHIVRDGRAVALSNRHKFLKSSKSEKEALLNSAKHWKDSLEKIKKQKNNTEIMEVRYEDFCSDIHRYLEKMLNFIGLDSNKFPFERCPKNLIPTNKKKWFSNASKEEMRFLEDIQESYLKEYNY
ncbi:MAG: hypothetical protein GF370_01870, partial [Candidatus Nealsonbacteria bacterium]|nr:hypothetical protein [Candidatus Nealsonbacteria bacterium]